MKKKKSNTCNPKRRELEIRRIRGVQQVLDGKKQRDVAEELGVSEAAISQWIKMFHEKGWSGLHAGTQIGLKRTFLDHHVDCLNQILDHKPTYWGYETDLWTTAIARDILYQRCGDFFSCTTILRWMHHLGFRIRSQK